MAKIIAVTNQKGGVAKTTTAINLGVGLVRKGLRVLFVDMDPQCSLSYILRGNCSGFTTRELLLQQTTAVQAIQQVPEGQLIAASSDLSTLDRILVQPETVFRLRDALLPVAGMYDYIIIDSPPTLSILTANILTAANGVIIPALADIFSVQGLGQLYASIQSIKNYCNPGITIQGILLVRYSGRLVLNRGMRKMLDDTAKKIGTRVFQYSIREAVTIREAEASRESLFKYAPRSGQTRDYAAFVEEFLRVQGK